MPTCPIPLLSASQRFCGVYHGHFLVTLLSNKNTHSHLLPKESHAVTGGSSAGLSGILTNFNAYQGWVRTVHERTKYVECTRRMAEMIPDQNKDQIHKDVRPSQMKKNEQDVVKTLHAVQNFVDPFAMNDTEHLYNITSSAPAPPDTETDVL